VKAFTTAVGDGPLPAELDNENADKLRQIGEEFGATTGRPRRCGWFDGVAIKYASWLNGMTSIAITKLDILDHFDTIKICVGYRMPDGTVITDYMPDTPLLFHAQPVYEEMEGWSTSTRDCRAWSDLPPAAQAYVQHISELAGVPVHYIGIGPEREQMFAVH